MPLSWNEIRDRATTFAHDWADESYERGEAQTFWNEFFRVFGLERRRVGAVKEWRSNSSRKNTRDLADTPFSLAAIRFGRYSQAYRVRCPERAGRT